MTAWDREAAQTLRRSLEESSAAAVAERDRLTRLIEGYAEMISGLDKVWPAGDESPRPAALAENFPPLAVAPDSQSGQDSAADANEPWGRDLQVEGVGLPAILVTRSARNIVLEALAAEGTWRSAKELHEIIGTKTMTDTTVRAVLRMQADQNAIEKKMRDGRTIEYRTPTSLQNAESPAATGLSVVPAPTHSRSGGGYDNQGTADPGDRPVD